MNHKHKILSMSINITTVRNAAAVIIMTIMTMSTIMKRSAAAAIIMTIMATVIIMKLFMRFTSFRQE